MKIAVELPKRPAILKGLKPDERIKLDTMHFKRADAYVVDDDLFIYWQATFKTFKSIALKRRGLERIGKLKIAVSFKTNCYFLCIVKI